MKIYIAGKITGDPHYKAKFDAAIEKLYACNIADEDDVIINPAAFPEGLTPRDYMRLSFAMIDAADAIMFLPDWVDSAGARLEMEYICYTDQSAKLSSRLPSRNFFADICRRGK